MSTLNLLLTDSFSVGDIPKFRLEPKLTESISFSDIQEKIPPDYDYFRWIFNTPTNPNFSFYEDFNMDGIADNWGITNGSGTIIQQKERHHVQQVQLITDGKFETIIDVIEIPIDREYLLYLNIEILSGEVEFDMSVYYDTTKLQTIYTRKFKSLPNIDWQELFTKVDVSGVPLFNKIKCTFHSNNTTFNLDNFMVIDDYATIMNPTTFDYSEHIYDTELYNLNKQKNIYLVPYKFKKFKGDIRCSWVVLNKTSLDFLKRIFNKRILIRTHDRKIITGKVNRMSVDYIPETYAKIVRGELTIICY